MNFLRKLILPRVPAGYSWKARVAIFRGRRRLLPRFFQQLPTYFLRARYSEIHEAERRDHDKSARKGTGGREAFEGISSREIESPKIVFRSHGFGFAAAIPDKH